MARSRYSFQRGLKGAVEYYSKGSKMTRISLPLPPPSLSSPTESDTWPAVDDAEVVTEVSDVSNVSDVPVIMPLPGMVSQQSLERVAGVMSDRCNSIFMQIQGLERICRHTRGFILVCLTILSMLLLSKTCG